MLTWAVQQNLLNDGKVNQVIYAAEQAGCNVVPVQIVPFSDEFGNENEVTNISGPIIPYGSTKLVKMANARSWAGLCYDYNRFDMRTWNISRKHEMLNFDTAVIPLSDVTDWAKDKEPNQKYFIRPAKDLKSFAGTVATVQVISDFKNSAESGNFSFHDDIRVCISPIKKIYNEMRFFIVGNKVIDGSYYRIGGKLQSHSINQPEIIQMAQGFADGWLPHDCCVMDIAETDDGYKIIEFNCINSSGFYDNNINKIVKALSDRFDSR